MGSLVFNVIDILAARMVTPTELQRHQEMDR